MILFHSAAYQKNYQLLITPTVRQQVEIPQFNNNRVKFLISFCLHFFVFIQSHLNCNQQAEVRTLKTVNFLKTVNDEQIRDLRVADVGDWSA